MSFAKKFGDKYGEKLMYIATKIEIDDAAKIASIQVVQKTAEATGDFIGNKIADKITSLGKAKSKEKEDERQKVYKPPEKRAQIIDDLRLLWYQKFTNLLGPTANKVPRFIAEKWVQVHDHSGSAEDRYKPSNK